MTNYYISQDQLSQLSRIYNTFLEVPVKGEGAFLHVDAMRALEKLVRDIATNPVQNNIDEIKE